jgi:hypothetical protein
LLLDLHVAGIGLRGPKMLSQLGYRPLVDTHLAISLLEAIPGLVTLLLRLRQQRSPGVQLALQTVQLRPLILHTPQRDLERHLRPSRGRGRREGSHDRRSRLGQDRRRKVRLRDIHRLCHRLWP